MFSDKSIKSNNKEKDRLIIRYPACTKTNNFKKINRPERRRWFTNSQKSPLINDFNAIHRNDFIKPRYNTFNLNKDKMLPNIPEENLNTISENNQLDFQIDPTCVSTGFRIPDINILDNYNFDSIKKELEDTELNQIDTIKSIPDKIVSDEELIFEKKTAKSESESESKSKSKSKSESEISNYNLEDDEVFESEENIETNQENKNDDINNSIEFTNIEKENTENNQWFFQKIYNYLF